MLGQSTEVLVFITMPQDQTAVDGKFVEFPCSACSTLEPTIMWTFTRKGSMHSEMVDENSMHLCRLNFWRKQLVADHKYRELDL